MNRLRLIVSSRKGQQERRLDVSAHGREHVVIAVVVALGVVVLALLWTVSGSCC